jgi:hypothetical protein
MKVRQLMTIAGNLYPMQLFVTNLKEVALLTFDSKTLIHLPASSIFIYVHHCNILIIGLPVLVFALKTVHSPRTVKILDWPLHN